MSRIIQNEYQKIMYEAIKHTQAPKVVRSLGDLNKVESDGRVYTRQQEIKVHGVGLVKCAPYDNHFVFRDTTNRLGWKLFCTCGSAAVVVNYNAYKKDNSSDMGPLLVCLLHAQGGKHNDGSN